MSEQLEKKSVKILVFEILKQNPNEYFPIFKIKEIFKQKYNQDVSLGYLYNAINSLWIDKFICNDLKKINGKWYNIFGYKKED